MAIKEIIIFRMNWFQKHNEKLKHKLEDGLITEREFQKSKLKFILVPKHIG